MNKNKKTSRKQKQRQSFLPQQRVNITRLRRNAAEFTTIIRGLVNDFNSGGSGSQSYAFMLNYPSWLRMPNGSYAQTGTTASILAQEQKTFDEYKVLSLKVSYLNHYTGQVRVSDVAATSGAGLPVSPLLVLSVDYDDSALFTSVAKAVNAQAPSFFNKFNTQQRPALTMRQADQIDSLKWLNLGNIQPNDTTPPDPNNPAKNSSLKVWVDQYQGTNHVDGAFIAEWLVQFRGVYELA